MAAGDQESSPPLPHLVPCLRAQKEPRDYKRTFAASPQKDLRGKGGTIRRQGLKNKTWEWGQENEELDGEPGSEVKVKWKQGNAEGNRKERRR